MTLVQSSRSKYLNLSIWLFLGDKGKVKRRSYYVAFNLRADICNGPPSIDPILVILFALGENFEVSVNTNQSASR